MQLTTHMLTYKQVETSFSLEQVTPKGSPAYSVVKIELARKLDEKETPSIESYASAFQDLIEKQGVPIQDDWNVENRSIDDLQHVDASELLGNEEVPAESERTND